MFICHPRIFFSEISVHIFCLLSNCIICFINTEITHSLHIIHMNPVLNVGFVFSPNLQLFLLLILGYIAKKVKVKSFSRVRLFATPWTVAHHTSPSMGFSRQECWSGCHFLLQRIFPTQGSNPGKLNAKKTFNFDAFNLSIFPFMDHAFDVKCKTFCHTCFLTLFLNALCF